MTPGPGPRNLEPNRAKPLAHPTGFGWLCLDRDLDRDRDRDLGSRQSSKKSLYKRVIKPLQTGTQHDAPIRNRGISGAWNCNANQESQAATPHRIPSKTSKIFPCTRSIPMIMIWRLQVSRLFLACEGSFWSLSLISL